MLEKYEITYAGPYNGAYQALWCIPGDRKWRVCEWDALEGGREPVPCDSQTDAVALAARALLYYLNNQA
jgi:hypothetical protein